MTETLDDKAETGIIEIQRVGKLSVDERTDEQIKETEIERAPPFIVDGILIGAGGEHTFVSFLDQCYNRDVAEAALILGYKNGDIVKYKIIVERKKD